MVNRFAITYGLNYTKIIRLSKPNDNRLEKKRKKSLLKNYIYFLSNIYMKSYIIITITQ